MLIIEKYNYEQRQSTLYILLFGGCKASSIKTSNLINKINGSLDYYQNSLSSRHGYNSEDLIILKFNSNLTKAKNSLSYTIGIISTGNELNTILPYQYGYSYKGMKIIIVGNEKLGV